MTVLADFTRCLTDCITASLEPPGNFQLWCARAVCSEVRTGFVDLGTWLLRPSQEGPTWGQPPVNSHPCQGPVYRNAAAYFFDQQNAKTQRHSCRPHVVLEDAHPREAHRIPPSKELALAWLQWDLSTQSSRRKTRNLTAALLSVSVAIRYKLKMSRLQRLAIAVLHTRLYSHRRHASSLPDFMVCT